LIAPLQTRLRPHLSIVPHGVLHTVPFQALHSGQAFLAQSHRISYSPSAQLYCTGSFESELGPALFIAFSAGPDTTSIQEVQHAAQGVPEARVLLNPSSEILRDALAIPRTLVHIAGHAGIDTITGKISWIETPHGRLTSRDFIDMQIRTRTLVITGCQTARREIRPGEEWLGLMRAFYLSGANTIISALWDIRDEVARRFSSCFYEHFRGNNASAAAHQACTVLRGWRDHPYFWAGFGIFERKAGMEAV
jgi:CHAT domain-containing protein